MQKHAKAHKSPQKSEGNRIIRKRQKKSSINLMFNKAAKKISDIVGYPITFALALLLVIVWGLSGKYFHYSETWQLIINTGTTIITFLIVFLIQNTQNRDTEILQLKLDELIKAQRSASNEVINLNELSGKELKQLEKEYCKLKNKKTGD